MPEMKYEKELKEWAQNTEEGKKILEENFRALFSPIDRELDSLDSSYELVELSDEAEEEERKSVSSIPQNSEMSLLDQTGDVSLLNLP
jgi:hypothetical protein